MFEVKDDLTIYCTRGDVALLSVTADENGVNYIFQPGDVVRMKVFEKKDCQCVVMQKDVIIEETTDKVDILLTGQETRICEVISKPKDFWYEVELNPETNPQTIIGYDEDGPKVFKMFPEGKEIEYEPGGDAPFLEELVEKEVTEYLTENPPKDGVDGLPCTHSWNGTILTITSANGTSAADLKGERGETGESGKDGKDGKDATVDYNLVANALKGNVSDEVISLDDVSPLEHMLKVKAQSKNIIPFPYYNESGYEDNGITYTYGADGIIYASGTNTATSRNYLVSKGNHRPSISAGTYTLSAIADVEGNLSGSSAILYVVDDSNGGATIHYIDLPLNGKPRVFTIDKDYTFYIYLCLVSGANPDNVAIRVQIEKGATATEYAPYVDVDETKVMVKGKNLLNVNGGNYVKSYASQGVETAEGFVKITAATDSSSTWTRVIFPVGLLSGFVGKKLTFKAKYKHSSGAFNPIIVFLFTDILIEGEKTIGNFPGPLLADKYLQTTAKNGEYTVVANINPEAAGTYKYLTIFLYMQNGGASATGDWAEWSDIQLEIGDSATAYEPYTEQEYSVNADGTVEGVQSIAPNMTIMSDMDGVTLDVAYNKDTNKVIEKLINRIAALESAVI